MKICKDCNVEYPKTTEFFGLANGGKSWQPYCRKCTAKRAKVWAENNKDKAKANNKRWIANNPDKKSQYWKTYIAKNSEKFKESQYKWRKINKESARLGTSRYRSRKRNNIGNAPYTEEQMLNLYGTNCYLCDMPIDINNARQSGKPGWKTSLWKDHLIAISNNGPDNIDNVRPSHGWCNLSKGAKHV